MAISFRIWIGSYFSFFLLNFILVSQGLNFHHEEEENERVWEREASVCMNRISNTFVSDSSALMRKGPKWLTEFTPHKAHPEKQSGAGPHLLGVTNGLLQKGGLRQSRWSEANDKVEEDSLGLWLCRWGAGVGAADNEKGPRGKTTIGGP